jgi:hypothetical protein
MQPIKTKIFYEGPGNNWILQMPNGRVLIWGNYSLIYCCKKNLEVGILTLYEVERYSRLKDK